MSIPFWACVLMTALSATVSTVFAVYALKVSRKEVLTSALYAVSRSVSLLIVAIVPILTRSVEWAATAALAMILVQLFDVFIGVYQKDVMKSVGPAFLAVTNMVALVALIRVA